MTELEFVQRDLDETFEAYAGAMRAVRRAHRLLLEGKGRAAQSVLLMAVAADEHECDWSDVAGDAAQEVNP